MTSAVEHAGGLSTPSVIEALLRPRSVAMIGASRNPNALGGRPLRFMTQYGFAGRIYPVSPSASEIQGLRAYASIGEVPERVDLAVVMVRAELVTQVLRECAAAGVRAAIVMSSGFGEGMGAGAGLLESVGPELLDAGMRILGPNCEGLASLPAHAPLTFSPVLDVEASNGKLQAGNIAVLSQSGGLGFAVAQWGTDVGVEFSYIITTGNEYDLDCVELAGHLVDAPDTDIVVLLVEALSELDEFARVSDRFREAGKRLVVAKLGKTEPGARGAYAHTRHVVGDSKAYSRLFREHGVLEVTSEEDLTDVLQAVAKTRRLGVGALPLRPRIGIVATSGGAGIWLADACVANGLTVPVLSAPLQEALKAHMPPYGSPVNPVDLTAQLTTGETLVPAIDLLVRSAEVDAVVLATSLSSAGRLEQDENGLADLASRSPLPIFIFSYTRPAASCVKILQRLGVPWYASAARTARGLAALIDEAEADADQTNGPQ